jgi:fructose-1,6-bisphosphatase I
MYCDV